MAVDNAQFLVDDGLLCLAIKARSEDVTADPQTVFEQVREELHNTYEILDSQRLAPFHDDHLGIVARKR